MPSSSSHPYLDSSAWLSLPSKPGIYIYKNDSGKIIYVGKAKSLKDRVSSYFRGSGLGVKTQILVSQIRSIDYIEVGSEIEALLLESQLIKKHQPQYNLISKDDKSPYYIHLTKETYPKPVLNHEPTGSLAGPFVSSWIAKSILKQFRKIAPYCVGKRSSGRECLYAHLGLCFPCPCKKLDAKDTTLYKANILKLRRLLAGNFSRVMSQLKKSMSQASKNLDYEQAAKIRDQINNLEYLLNKPISANDYIANPNLTQDIREQALSSLQFVLGPHIGISKLNRIELYDNAHLQGSSPTSAMVVAVNGEPNPKHYRHFTLGKRPSDPNTSNPDDVAYMSEVLKRRLTNQDWPLPDLIVLDGGKPQLSILKSSILNLESIPIIGLAKREETIIIPRFDGLGVLSGYSEISLPLDHPGLRLLMKLRDEAHRFSRRLHHKHQTKKMLQK